MVHKTETVMPREAMPETKDLFNTTKKIPLEKLHDFFQFMRGVSYGMDLAAGKQMMVSQQGRG